MDATTNSDRIAVALEVGPKRKVFAWAAEWPGWCRAGRTEEAATLALLAYAPRYETVARDAGLAFGRPESVGRFSVVERLEGNATTDFGAPARLARNDLRPLTAGDRRRLAAVLAASWARFDAVFGSIPLAIRTSKPAVGRSPAMMRFHLVETDVMHLAAFGQAYREPAEGEVERLEPAVRSTFLKALAAVPRDRALTPVRRYGFDWTPRFAVRRAAWHALDHAWQLEDALAGAVTPPSPPSGSRPPATPADPRRAARRRSPARGERA